jgi:hypothetical protein
MDNKRFDQRYIGEQGKSDQHCGVGIEVETEPPGMH